MRTRYLLTLVVFAAACGGSSTGPAAGGPPPNAANVQATNALTFQPGSVTIAAGGTVTWQFFGVGHNVTFTATPGAPADISGVNMNVSIARMFTTPGTFNYHCTIHPGMAGTVVVQ